MATKTEGARIVCPVPTRWLIILAGLCGLAILVAFTVQVLLAT